MDGRISSYVCLTAHFSYDVYNTVYIAYAQWQSNDWWCKATNPQHKPKGCNMTLPIAYDTFTYHKIYETNQNIWFIHSFIHFQLSILANFGPEAVYVLVWSPLNLCSLIRTSMEQNRDILSKPSHAWQKHTDHTASSTPRFEPRDTLLGVPPAFSDTV